MLGFTCSTPSWIGCSHCGWIWAWMLLSSLSLEPGRSPMRLEAWVPCEQLTFFHCCCNCGVQSFLFFSVVGHFFVPNNRTDCSICVFVRADIICLIVHCLQPRGLNMGACSGVEAHAQLSANSTPTLNPNMLHVLLFYFLSGAC